MLNMPIGKNAALKSELIDYFINNGSIQQGDFVGKSGNHYSIETDIRCAFCNHLSALSTAKMLDRYITSIGVPDHPFIGVPETGTLISFYLNQVRFDRCESNYSVNMMRAVAKEYQKETNTVFTVLPIDQTQSYILIEDDVVTGNTLVKYLRQAIGTGVKIEYVVSVFGRESAKAVADFCSQNDIKYIEIIDAKECEV